MSTDAMMALALLGLALLMDGLVGEYPSLLHPVVGMGQAIALGMRWAPTAGWWKQFLFGMLLTLLVVDLGAGLVWILLYALADYPLLGILVGAYFLKASFALRELGQAALRVVVRIEQGDLPAARQALRSLCSRDPSDLDAEQLLAAGIESLAENASDSLVAPLFYFVLLGVPGAIGYRAINTLDAMIGYRGEYEALGKFAARLDDLANWIPARITALLFLMTGGFLGGNVMRGVEILWRDGGKTPSPNGGRPMAVMAGLLEVRLDKQGVYSLGEPRLPLTPARARQAWHIVLVSGIVLAGLCLLAMALAGCEYWQMWSSSETTR